MAYRDMLKAVSLANLTYKQRADVKKAFQARKKQLEVALAAVNQGLEELAQSPKPKKAAK
jgi:hypothetical protein